MAETKPSAAEDLSKSLRFMVFLPSSKNKLAPKRWRLHAVCCCRAEKPQVAKTGRPALQGADQMFVAGSCGLRPLQQVARTRQRDNFFETLGFRGGDFAAVRRQSVIAAALVVVGQGALAALDNQPIIEQALDDAVEGAGAEFDFATGAHLDF